MLRRLEQFLPCLGRLAGAATATANTVLVHGWEKRLSCKHSYGTFPCASAQIVPAGLLFDSEVRARFEVDQDLDSSSPNSARLPGCWQLRLAALRPYGAVVKV
jgi:hypothetical protein